MPTTLYVPLKSKKLKVNSYIALQDIFLKLGSTLLEWLKNNWYWVLAGCVGLGEFIPLPFHTIGTDEDYCRVVETFGFHILT